MHAMVMLTRRVDIMGVFVNRKVTTWIASAIAAVIIALNGFLLYGTFAG